MFNSSQQKLKKSNLSGETFYNNFIILGTTQCFTTCEISLKFNNSKWNRLVSVSMVFKNHNYSSGTGCTTSYEAELVIDCSKLATGKCF